MRCATVRRRLIDYSNGTLSISEEEQVRRHLERCPHCADLAEGLHQAAKVLRALPRLETSSEFVGSLRRHLPVAVALARRPPGPWGGLRRRLLRKRRFQRHVGLVLVPVALALALWAYLWNLGAAPTATRPVISERAYLAAVAREHALYASEHPLMDTSAANLSATWVSPPRDR